MTKITYENDQLKRSFFEHLDGAEGFAKQSVNKFAEAIAQWETFSGNDDFANFDKSKAVAFRDWQIARSSKTKSGHISLASQYNYLRRIKRFFKWLSDQPGYKNKILKSDVDFLRLSKKDARIATSGTTRKMPTFEEVRQIIESIPGKSEIDMRDKALLSLALITGVRISAIISLKIKNFDRQNKLLDQNPGDGVKTKNSKNILTTFFPIGWDGPEKYFLEWFDYLIAKGYQSNDPIFPSTARNLSNEKVEYGTRLVSKDFWNASGGARKIFEKRCLGASLPYFNPHSFRHLVVNIMSKTRLTEEEKRAISLNLGHENVGTTFGSYGYGSMSREDAVKIVQKISTTTNENGVLTEEQRLIIEKLLKRR